MKAFRFAERTPENFPAIAHFKLPFTLGHEKAGWLAGGAMVGGSEGRGGAPPPPPGFQPDRRVMGGVRAELAVPISVDVHDRVSVVTGATLPFTLMFARDVDPWGIIPILIRMGVEINASPKVAPFFSFELGPGIGIGSQTTDVDFAFRIWVGTAFWSVLGK